MAWGSCGDRRPRCERGRLTVRLAGRFRGRAAKRPRAYHRVCRHRAWRPCRFWRRMGAGDVSGADGSVLTGFHKVSFTDTASRKALAAGGRHQVGAAAQRTRRTRRSRRRATRLWRLIRSHQMGYLRGCAIAGQSIIRCTPSRFTRPRTTSVAQPGPRPSTACEFRY